MDHACSSRVEPSAILLILDQSRDSSEQTYFPLCVIEPEYARRLDTSRPHAPLPSLLETDLSVSFEALDLVPHFILERSRLP